MNFYNSEIFASDCITVQAKNEDDYSTKLLYQFLSLNQQTIYDMQRGQAQPHVYAKDIETIRLPLIQKNTQEQIVKEITLTESKERDLSERIGKLSQNIDDILNNITGPKEPLKNIIEINPSKTQATSARPDTSVSFIEMASVSNEGYITEVVLKELKEVRQGYTYFQNGDVLFAKITPCMENGKGALVNDLKTDYGFGSTEFFVLRASDKILNSLIYHFTRQKYFRVEAEKNMAGASGHKRVPKSFIESYEVPVPSIIEQRLIVEEIKKIEIKIAELKSELADIPAQKAAILQKYLN